MAEIISIEEAQKKAREEELRRMLITPDSVLEHLRQAIFRAYRFLAADDAAFPHHSAGNHLDDISEHLDGQPINRFGATHVSLLERLIAYWCECQSCAGAPRPPELSKQENDESILVSMRRDMLLLRPGVLHEKTANQELWESDNPDPNRLYELHVVTPDRSCIEVDGVNFEVSRRCLHMEIDEADLQALRTNAVGTPTTVTDRISKKRYVVRRVAGDVWLELVSELDQSA